MAPLELHTAHIDGLVNAGLQFDMIATRDDARLAGQMLLQQHYRSIGVLRDHEDPPDYTASLADHAFHPVAVLRLLDSYEYQSDETADWTTGPACTWINRLRDEVLSRLPAETKARMRYGSLSVPAYQLLPAYTDTPWAVTALEQIPNIGDSAIEIPVVRKGLPAEIRFTACWFITHRAEPSPPRRSPEGHTAPIPAKLHPFSFTHSGGGAALAGPPAFRCQPRPPQHLRHRLSHRGGYRCRWATTAVGLEVGVLCQGTPGEQGGRSGERSGQRQRAGA